MQTRINSRLLTEFIFFIMITLIKITQIVLVLWLVNQVMRLFRKPQPHTNDRHGDPQGDPQGKPQGKKEKRAQSHSKRFDAHGKDVEDADFEEVDDHDDSR
jgi:hypothetical protein